MVGLGAHTHGPRASVSSRLPRPPQPGIGRGRGWGAASPSLCAKALGPTRRCQEAPAQPWGAVAGAVSGGWVGSGRPPPPGSAEGQGFQAGCPVLGGRVPRVVPAPVRGRGRGPALPGGCPRPRWSLSPAQPHCWRSVLGAGLPAPSVLTHGPGQGWAAPGRPAAAIRGVNEGMTGPALGVWLLPTADSGSRCLSARSALT